MKDDDTNLGNPRNTKLQKKKVIDHPDIRVIDGEEVLLWQYSKSDPDCEHCGTILRSIEKWPQFVHDNCPCICHTWKSTEGKRRQEEIKKQSRKRKKK